MAELSMDGSHRIDTFLNHTAGIGSKNLTDFTICLRFNINFLKPIKNALVSYSTFLEDNALNVEIDKRNDGLLLFICKYIKRNQVTYIIFSRVNLWDFMIPYFLLFLCVCANRVVDTMKLKREKYTKNGTILVCH